MVKNNIFYRVHNADRNLNFLTKPEFKIVLFCVFLRVILFSLYGNKVSECPDSWAFNHFAEKMTEQLNSRYSNLFITSDVDLNQVASLPQKNIDNKIGTFIGERSPGYPIIIFLSTSKYLTVIFQFILGIITALIWYRTLLKLKFSLKSSLFIVIFLQCYLSFFIYETFILVETITLFLISILFYFISDGYLTQKKSIKFEISFSMILGYLVLVKPFFVILPCILLAIRFLNQPSFKLNFDRKIIILLFSFISYFGWSMVVKKYTGYFVSTTYFGLNKAQNCVYFAEKGPKEYNWIIKPYVKHREIAIKEHQDVSMSIWFALNAGEFKNKNMDFPELSNEFGKFADVTIQNNFTDYCKQVVTKSWFDFWKVFDVKELIRFDNPKAEFLVTHIFKFQNIIITILKCCFLVLSLFYFYLFLRKKTFNFQFIVSVIVWSISIVQGVVTYGTNAKYSFPFEYLMIIVVMLFIKENYKKVSFLDKQKHIS